jgi:hypothetical protein
MPSNCVAPTLLRFFPGQPCAKAGTRIRGGDDVITDRQRIVRRETHSTGAVLWVPLARE